MSGLYAIVFCLMFFGASLWEHGDTKGIILFVIGVVIAIPLMISTWKREEHI